MQIFEPVSCLTPFVKAFVVVESADTFVNRLLPDTSLVAAFRLHGQVHYQEQDSHTRLPTYSISGLRKSFKIARYDKNSANILVQFKEGGAAAFFDLPIHELLEANVALDNFFKFSELMFLSEQLEAAYSIEGKVNVVQQFLTTKLRRQEPDLLIAHSIEKIKMAKGIISVKDLAESLYVSMDVFEKRFRKVIGTTPKQFANIVRMKTLIGHAPSTGLLLDSALDAGFFDHSHFIRNFKSFTGQTPTEFFNVAKHPV
ncbi:helix-turn-helix transcriptional regulator [Dyadobacter chenwenxiniae]|uniref:Helix-turn-helix transcriptional regulator n=1 Tax=Dyadobacter chenwenxiniae TaxID=2906456 RepID=A0A9X1PNW9_9BACT|nr:response regulator transcription factor [Dyadobacter chenwenxiniae]MCF0064635.1 helix-turn-helix transcriptional regulator [Dyadobacter chenwenxiniae]UON84309.1 helix-turn-helix transcriptional regulator [Dyadobacter chenwenxiniae]